MRGAQKAQPFGHPLDGRVRARRCLQLLASNRDRLGLHRAVLEFVFQVRPSSKIAPGFASAAALCGIVRFAARLSWPRRLRPSPCDAGSQRTCWPNASRLAARAKLAPRQTKTPALRCCAVPANGSNRGERCLLPGHASELPKTRPSLC